MENEYKVEVSAEMEMNDHKDTSEVKTLLW